MLISDNQIAVWNIYDKKKDLELLNKILSNSMKKKIALHLSGTGNKLKLLDNRSEKKKTCTHSEPNMSKNSPYSLILT